MFQQETMMQYKRQFSKNLLAWRTHSGANALLTQRSAGSNDMANAIANLIDDLQGRGRLKGTDVANIADVSAATVSRWRTGKATPQPRTQLLIADLRYVVDRLADIYTPDETRIWLYSRNALLDGERAIDLIREKRTEEVLAVIERLDAGAYL